jgi:hypothetical protein
VVPPCSDRISRVPPYSRTILGITRTGLSPAEADLSRSFRLSLYGHWPSPRSLATTSGVSVDVLSSGYLDVSVPRVCFFIPILFRKKIPLIKCQITNARLAPDVWNLTFEGGLPHSEIHGSKPVRGSPWLIAAYHVLHRLLLPRHPPNALRSLDALISNAC